MSRASSTPLALAAGLSLLAAPLAHAADAAKAEKAEKPADKAADAKAPAAAPAAPATPAPELPERVIEKKDGDYLFKLTMRPGALKPNRVADVTVEVARLLEIPDPVSGDRIAMSGAHPVAQVTAPASVLKAKPSEASLRYVLYPATNPGSFGFHFTPTTDGVYDVKVTGADPKSEEERSFETTFHLGVGTAAAQTEQSQGTTGSRRGGRRVVGSSGSAASEDKLQKLMEEIGQRYLDLEASLQAPPAKGPHTDAAAEARALAQLFTQVKGLTPESYHSASGEFDKLAGDVGEKLEAVAVAAEGKDRQAPRTALEKVELQGCNQCHAKFRWAVTTDLSGWPAFTQKSWKK